MSADSELLRQAKELTYQIQRLADALVAREERCSAYFAAQNGFHAKLAKICKPFKETERAEK
jgi:hypothetical protein